MILGYPPIAMLETLKEWKVAITSVRQGYKLMEGHHDYKTSTGTTYGGRGQPIDIGRSNDNFKDRKLKCFNYNKYGHIAKVSQIRHSLVVILELNGVSEVQYKDVMMIDDGKYQ